MSSSSSSSERRRKVYVAGYSSRDDEHDIKKAFKKYGKIEEISWKGRFCFVVFDLNKMKTFRESKDAERAIRKLHKESLHGHTLVVEFARSRGANDGSCYNCNKKGHL
jgi:arginine/serine-rich splicing factor 7